MASAVTILSPLGELSSVIEAIHQSREVALRVIGKNTNWSSLQIESPNGSMTLNPLIRLRPGDKFSKIVLGMHNFFNEIRTRAKNNKAYVLERVASVELMIGVVAEPEFSETDIRLDCLWKVAECLDALVFNGDALLNSFGQKILGHRGEHDIVM